MGKDYQGREEFNFRYLEGSLKKNCLEEITRCSNILSQKVDSEEPTGNYICPGGGDGHSFNDASEPEMMTVSVFVFDGKTRRGAKKRLKELRRHDDKNISEVASVALKSIPYQRDIRLGCAGFLIGGIGLGYAVYRMLVD